MSQVWLITGSSRGLRRALAHAVRAAERTAIARVEADRTWRGLSVSTDPAAPRGAP